MVSSCSCRKIFAPLTSLPTFDDALGANAANAGTGGDAVVFVVVVENVGWKDVGPVGGWKKTGLIGVRLPPMVTIFLFEPPDDPNLSSAWTYFTSSWMYRPSLPVYFPSFDGRYFPSSFGRYLMKWKLFNKTTLDDAFYTLTFRLQWADNDHQFVHALMQVIRPGTGIS